MDINSVVNTVVANQSPIAKNDKTYGKTVGEPKLSDTGKKYLDELKKKYNNMDIVLVSKDQKENAKANASKFANADKMVVLIDEEKIEKMATDESFRKKYEGIIAMAGQKVPELKEAFAGNDSVKGFGLEVKDDGNASFFAVVKKSQDAQAQRIKAKAEEKKAQKKEDEKKAEKKEREEKLQEARKEKAEATKDARLGDFDPDEYEVIEASSVEELVKKVSDYGYMAMSDNVLSAQELVRGQTLDLKV